MRLNGGLGIISIKDDTSKHYRHIFATLGVTDYSIKFAGKFAMEQITARLERDWNKKEWFKLIEEHGIFLVNSQIVR